MHNFSGVATFCDDAAREGEEARTLQSLRQIDGAAGASTSSLRGHLARIIEDEIVPRLLVSSSVRQAARRERVLNLPSEIGELVRLALQADPGATLAYVDGLIERGLPRQAILLDFLAPAARQLGKLWEADHCDFIDVTNGLRQLRTMMDELTVDWGLSSEHVSRDRRVLLSPAPGETHVFGIAMVEGFFRAAGWSVAQCGADRSISALRKQPYAIFGVSVSCRRYAESLRLAIQTARQESKNTSILILVGGDLVNQDPALVQAVGADGTAADARCAVATAEKLASRPYYT